MNINIKYLLIAIAFIVACLPSNAQEIMVLPDGQTVKYSYRPAESGAPISDDVARMYRGTIVDIDGNPLSGVNVSCCYDCLCPQIYGAASDKNGNFAVKVVQGHYYVEFTAPGYDKQRLDVDLFDDSDAGSVVLARSGLHVSERNQVQIKYMRKYYQINVNTKLIDGGDKTLVNLLKDAPFIDVWQEPYSVMLNPKYEIRIDGRTVKAAPQIMAKYFSSIPAGNVRSIKVVTASMAQELPTVVVIATQ